VRASNGKTIEILNTDAEGRLILADALVYAAGYKPATVIDIATLTGAAVIALGEGGAAALFTDDELLAERLSLASQSSGERIWRMPLFPEYAEWVRGSDVADLRNIPGKRYAGAGTSAAFLQEFTEGSQWAHLDIAPMASLPASKVVHPLGPAGATGFGVRLLAHMMLDGD
jgi:leucyl aminopeptidase